MNEDNTVESIKEVLFKITRQMKGKMSYTKNLTHLSHLQIQTLIFIKKNQKVSMTDIAKYFCIELPSVTSLLNKLSDRKLIIRYEDEQDRRLVMVTLTDSGKILLKQARREQHEKLNEVLSCLSKKEKNDLLLILQTLHTRLQK